MSPCFPSGSGYDRVLYTYVWHCAVCEGTALIKMESARGGPIFIPDLPEGWLVIGDRHICPNHEVVTLVDGKEWTER